MNSLVTLDFVNLQMENYFDFFIILGFISFNIRNSIHTIF